MSGNSFAMPRAFAFRENGTWLRVTSSTHQGIEQPQTFPRKLASDQKQSDGPAEASGDRLLSGLKAAGPQIRSPAPVRKDC